MSAKGMGDKRPAAIASAGDAASGAKAAMHTPYGRLRNRARTRSVRPPRPVRCAIRARVARQTAAARPARKSPLTAADPAARRWPRIACRGKAPASRPVRRNTGRVARKETAARSVNPYRAHCVSGLLASGGQWHTEHIASCPMRHNTGRVARRTAAARPARKPPPIPRRGAGPGLLAAGKDARRALLCSRLPERRSHAAARFARSMRSRSRMAAKYGDGAVCAPYSFPDGHHPARNLRSGGAGEGAQLSGTTSPLYTNYSLNASLTNSC